jgi:mRNA interferase MazF
MLVDFGSGVGGERAGVRPALVRSNDAFNRHFALATVLPLTKREGKRRSTYSFEVVLPAGAAGNAVESIAMPHQVSTVARERLLRRIGRLSGAGLQAEIEDRLLDHLGYGYEPDDG